MTQLVEQVAGRIAEVSDAWRERVTAPVASAADPVAAAASLPADIALGTETIREGWLLHRGTPRVGGTGPSDPDLDLLVGDWCYAAGLCDVAEHGTLDQVASLAALIADVSLEHTAPAAALEPRWDAALVELAGVVEPHDRATVPAGPEST